MGKRHGYGVDLCIHEPCLWQELGQTIAAGQDSNRAIRTISPCQQQDKPPRGLI